MTLENKLTELEIGKILIVDDSKENIEAAKKCFSEYKDKGIEFDYASSASEAVQKIKSSYDSKKYDLVLSDLQMEDKVSGLEVTKTAFSHQGIAGIVTGTNYDKPMNAPHGPNTALFIGNKNSSVAGKKEVPEVWKNIFDDAVQYLSGDGKNLIESMKRYHKYVHKPSEETGELANKFYSGLAKK